MVAEAQQCVLYLNSQLLCKGVFCPYSGYPGSPSVVDRLLGYSLLLSSYFICLQWIPLNSHGKCAEKLCELSEDANYLSLFYVK